MRSHEVDIPLVAPLLQDLRRWDGLQRSVSLDSTNEAHLAIPPYARARFQIVGGQLWKAPARCVYRRDETTAWALLQMLARHPDQPDVDVVFNCRDGPLLRRNWMTSSKQQPMVFSYSTDDSHAEVRAQPRRLETGAFPAAAGCRRTVVCRWPFPTTPCGACRASSSRGRSCGWTCCTRRGCRGRTRRRCSLARASSTRTTTRSACARAIGCASAAGRGCGCTSTACTTSASTRRRSTAATSARRPRPRHVATSPRAALAGRYLLLAPGSHAPWLDHMKHTSEPHSPSCLLRRDAAPRVRLVVAQAQGAPAPHGPASASAQAEDAPPSASRHKMLCGSLVFFIEPEAPPEPRRRESRGKGRGRGRGKGRGRGRGSDGGGDGGRGRVQYDVLTRLVRLLPAVPGGVCAGVAAWWAAGCGCGSPVRLVPSCSRPPP